MSQTTRVLIFETCRHDCGGLTAFGDVLCLFDRNIRRSSIWLPEFSSDVQERLAVVGFDPRTDYFAMVGSTVPVTLVLVTMLRLYRQVNVLFYNATNQEYVARTLSIDEVHDARHARGSEAAVCAAT